MTRGLRRGLAIALVVVALALRWWRGAPDAAPDERGDRTATRTATQAEGQVEGIGVVERVLADDDDGSRHQRFIVRQADGRTLLVAHNIDLAPRIPRLARGDTVAYFGEFEPNEQGGVIHWTHRDPAGRHVAGWLKHAGRTYQ